MGYNANGAPWPFLNYSYEAGNYLKMVVSGDTCKREILLWHLVDKLY